MTENCYSPGFARFLSRKLQLKSGVLFSIWNEKVHNWTWYWFLTLAKLSSSGPWCWNETLLNKHVISNLLKVAWYPTGCLSKNAAWKHSPARNRKKEPYTLKERYNSLLLINPNFNKKNLRENKELSKVFRSTRLIRLVSQVVCVWW